MLGLTARRRPTAAALQPGSEQLRQAVGTLGACPTSTDLWFKHHPTGVTPHLCCHGRQVLLRVMGRLPYIPMNE